MKKLINRRDRYVDEALGGLCAAYPGVYRRYRERNRIIARARQVARQGGPLTMFLRRIGRRIAVPACCVWSAIMAATRCRSRWQRTC
jgi:hypothetical protein